MADWKSLLADQGPKIALAMMAAKQHGPQAAAAFMQGIQESQMRQQQSARQRGMDAQAQEQQAFQNQNVTDDNARQDENARIDRVRQALALMQSNAQQLGETADDPEQAQVQLGQTAQSAAGLYGVDPTQLAGMVPNVAPTITKRKQKQAFERYEALKKIYGEEAVASDSITDNGEQFKGMKPSQILALAQMGAQTAEGAPAQPYVKPTAAQQPPTPGSFEEFVGAPPDRQAVIESARKRYMQADDRAASAAAPPQEPLVAIMGPDGAPVLAPRSQAVGKRPASTREQGRSVQSSDANRIADLKTSLNDLATLKRDLGTTGAASKIGAMLPNAVTEFTGWGSDAKQRQAVIDRVKQVIGKALEDGVLRKEDEYKYVKILPTIGDPPEVATRKIDGLEQAITQRLDTTLEALANANFDTSKFTESGGPKADPLGIR